LQILEHNITIIQEIFPWLEIVKFDAVTINKISKLIGSELSPANITIKSPWKSLRIFEIYDQANPTYYIKEMWEMEFAREVLGIEIGRILDPELCMEQYLFGTFTSGIFHTKKPYLLTSWIAGKPIEKKQALNYAFALGQQYEFGRWLCLYDCHPRHYFAQEDGSLRRIDYGLAFSKFHKKYEGFADIWPKELFTDPRFLDGMKRESQKIHARFDIGQDRIFNICRRFSQLQHDDLITFDPQQFFERLMYYWRQEKIIDDTGCLISQYNFLHSPIETSLPEDQNSCPWVIENFKKSKKIN
jgi:hypothetical protein